MPEARVNGVRLYYEERGAGVPILCIHGGGSTALLWVDAVEELSRLGRVIAYDRVLALVLLEGDALGLSPAALEWTKGLADRLREVAARDGVDAVYAALIGAVLGEGSWDSFPDEVRHILSQNGPPLLAELGYVDEELPGPAAFATIAKPALLVTASESPVEQREMTEAMAGVLPDARTALVGGGHLIDPAAPEVLAFIGEVLERDRAGR